MVEVFKTDVCQESKAEEIIKILLLHSQEYKINFDLEDCDKILRVESFNGDIDNDLILNLVKQSGCYIEILPD